jgi:hypothetical protein
MTTPYLNTDLDIESTEDLGSLIAYLGDAVDVLFQGESDGRHLAILEVAGCTVAPDEAIAYFCALLESLPADVRAVWETAQRKTFDLGFGTGATTPKYYTAIQPATLQRATALGASIAITIYPSDNCANNKRLSG